MGLLMSPTEIVFYFLPLDFSELLLKDLLFLGSHFVTASVECQWKKDGLTIFTATVTVEKGRKRRVAAVVAAVRMNKRQREVDCTEMESQWLAAVFF